MTKTATETYPVTDGSDTHEFQVAEHKRRVKQAKNQSEPLDGYYEKEPASEMVPIDMIEAGIYEVGDTPSDSIGQMIEAVNLYPSPTNPRKRFPQESIEELAISIKEQGVIEPLIVRERDMPNLPHRTFEIVCGERRYRASMRAEQMNGTGNGDTAKLPCIVRELTDEQVLDIQIHENLHREDVHPMDEAYGYKFLQDKLGCDLKELSLRVGKSEAFILNRLKLNQLTEEIQADIESGVLPLAYALEIAKFGDPATQKQIHEECFDSDWSYDLKTHVPNKSRLEPFRRLLSYINDQVLFQLSKAPFDRKAENLRTDGLSCVKCPERTGANVGLFDAYDIGKKDSCLNPDCYRAKSFKHVELVRAKIAADDCIDLDEVPLVSDRYSTSPEGALSLYDYNKVNESEAGKPGVVRAVSIAPDSFGNAVYIRKVQKSSSSSSSSAKPVSEKAREAAMIENRERKEELFDIRVGEAVRMRVFRRAAEHFATNAEIGLDIEAILPRMLAFMWATANNGMQGSTKGKIVEPLMAEAMDVSESSLAYSYEIDHAEKKIAELSESNQLRMLFLFTHGDKGAMYYDRYSSQKAVRDLATEYMIDYDLLDAEVRVEFATAKSKPMFEKYLADIKGGVKALKIPRQFTETYKPRN